MQAPTIGKQKYGLGKLWGIFILVCMILGVLNASNGVNKEVPLIGGIHLL